MVWEENPEYIRIFYDNFETNKKLCQEVEYILSTELNKEDIEIAHVSSRAKTLNSFCEKIYRKSYTKPFDEINDFAGVRVVFLYSTDRPKLEQIIEREFDVIERIDKVLTDEEKFGYGALHYLVKIKENRAGTRYDDLKNRICEIQVRTILQDAWALVAHHLSYKRESDVPKELSRKLNALSGLFETADDQFENIRNIRGLYQAKVEKSIQNCTELSNQEEANIDNLEAYLESKFPGRKHEGIVGISELLEELKRHGYATLAEINAMINSAIEAVLASEAEFPPTNATHLSTVGLARTALTFMSDDFLQQRFGENNAKKRAKRLDKFRHLIKGQSS